MYFDEQNVFAAGLNTVILFQIKAKAIPSVSTYLLSLKKSHSHLTWCLNITGIVRANKNDVVSDDVTKNTMPGFCGNNLYFFAKTGRCF